MRNSKPILLIEDDDVDVMTVNRALRDLKVTNQLVSIGDGEEAIEYLVMKDIPRHIWSQEYNRPMFKIVKTEDVPSDRQFRNAWRLAA